MSAEWPIGPVCQSCYTHVRNNPAPCATCNCVKVLTGSDAAGTPVCGPCADGRDYTCSGCGRPGHLYAAERCLWCVLDERVRDLLAGPASTMPDHFAPLHTALTDTDKPVLRWLQRSTSSRLSLRIAQYSSASTSPQRSCANPAYPPRSPRCSTRPACPPRCSSSKSPRTYSSTRPVSAPSTKLARTGTKIALDDFGTGNCRLAEISNLPVDTVNIAACFIDFLRNQHTADHADHTVLTSMITLSHNLDLTVTAEGIQTATQAQRLTELGCDTGQGFHLGRPQPAAQITDLLSTRTS